MNFYDAPNDPCLPLSGFYLDNEDMEAAFGARLARNCGGQSTAPGSVLSFSTTLVGVVSQDGLANLPGPAINFTWTSSFNGTTGGVSGVLGTGALPDPGSGTGGVTLVSINGAPSDEVPVPEPMQLGYFLIGIGLLPLLRIKPPRGRLGWDPSGGA